MIYMEISENNLKLISEALDTQIRLLDSYINKNQEQEARILRFRLIKDDIDTLLLRQ